MRLFMRSPIMCDTYNSRTIIRVRKKISVSFLLVQPEGPRRLQRDAVFELLVSPGRLGIIVGQHRCFQQVRRGAVFPFTFRRGHVRNDDTATAVTSKIMWSPATTATTVVVVVAAAAAAAAIYREEFAKITDVHDYDAIEKEVAYVQNRSEENARDVSFLKRMFDD